MPPDGRLAAMAPSPVIMDVDTGIDDAFALMLAVRHPGIELRAVTCVGGNTGVDQVVANTCYVLDAAGAGEVPLARGAAAPLLVPPADAGRFHCGDGLGGFSRQSDRRIDRRPAVDLLRHELSSAVATGEPVTLVATAPLTNIALLLRAHPEVAAGIERLVFMGGSAGPGNVTAAAEHNVFHDPEAAAITLAATRDLDIPTTMYGLDVFEQVLVDRSDADRLAGSLDPACQLAAALIRARCALLDMDAITIGDAGTVCAVADPDGLTTHPHPVRVETGFGYTRGQTVVDRRESPVDRVRLAGHLPPTVLDVAEHVDARGYADLWVRTLLG
jgi:pyrimidine-specific ribonucleoside hydrolase